MEDEPDTVRVFSNEDIAILRNGKAKKNDPPIPEDLAPISGGGKRFRREKKEENSAFLDPIKFRYSQEAVVEEPVETELVAEEQGENRKNRRNRNRNKPKAERNMEETPALASAPAEPQDTPEENAEKPKNNHRRRYYHHRRKPKSGE
jgi:hypothetical protein